MPKTYFISLIIFDDKHQRSNHLYHSGMVLMEGNKDAEGRITDLAGLRAMGFYSHAVPKGIPTNIIERIWPFRIKGYYAELKDEALTTVDLGFGLTVGPLIEINEEEKDQLLKDIETQHARLKTFFQQSDMDALAEMKQTYPDFDPANVDPIKDKKYLKIYDDIQTKHREAAYTQAWKKIEAQDKSLFAFMPSRVQADKDKLKHEEGVYPFNISIARRARTCKTDVVDFLIDSLKTHSQPNDKRIKELSHLTSAPLIGPFPRSTQNKSHIIFDTRESEYQSTNGSFLAPKREWKNVYDGKATCKLQFLSTDQYISLDGSVKSLHEVLISKQAQKIFLVMNENLVFLKRVLNSLVGTKYDTENKYRDFLRDLDETLDRMITLQNKNLLNSAIEDYQLTLWKLAKNGCFNSLRKMDDNIKMETGIVAELSRLDKIIHHGIQVNALTHDDLLGRNKAAELMIKMFCPKQPVKNLPENPFNEMKMEI